jgi:ribosomal protein S18 acetylase RimI-like enzyme
VFSDYEPSELLADVLAAESSAQHDSPSSQLPDRFGIAAFRGDVLVGWTQGYREGATQFYMLNSGVSVTARRNGVYSRLVQGVLAHARAKGYASVRSRHAADNNGVIIAKLRLGFQVSGFEYSEVYGPLVQLAFLVHEERRRLYTQRAVPIRPAAK